MASVYSVFADRLEYEPIEEWVDERDEHVLYGRIAFWPDAERRPKNWLCLNREWVVEGRVERYAGPIVVVVAGADAEGGITLAELGPNYLRLELDAEAAARIEDDQVQVEFDLDEADFAQLRDALAEMFVGSVVLRVQDAKPGTAPDSTRK